MELDGKTIIITGGNSGIGAAAARLFAAEGAHVVLGARREAELARVSDRIRAAGGRAVWKSGDVCDPGYHAALVALALAEFGRLDGAFNNAGMVGEMAPTPQLAMNTWKQVIDTNLTSAFLAARAQIPALQQNKGGALVFTSSFVGHSNGGLPGMGAYAASKAGLIGYVRSLAMEHAGENIRVNALLPGGTRTPMAGDDPDQLAFIAGLHPMRRLAEPEEIAQAALFLMSARASFVTGAPIAADGGIGVRFL